MMQNRSIQKKSSKITSYKLLKKNLRMMIINKSLYSSLTILTPFRNLVKLTLQECTFNLKKNFLPKQFGTLHHLQKLTISKNFVVNTTQSAWEWLKEAPFRSSLELLKISNNNLSSIEIKYLKNFTKLIINWNRINSSPKKSPLPFLNLDLSLNNLGRSEWFAWEWLMQAHIRDNLRILNISCNYLTAVPLQINYMKNLQSLFLYGNEIQFIPKEFGNLSQLMNLDLSENLLEKGGHSTWEWLENPIRDNLSELDLCDNSLTKFPLQITLLTNLRSLDISENKIEFLPKELGTLPLTYLDLSLNSLGKSDSNIWEWLEQAAIRNELSELRLVGNLLTYLPPQIGKLNVLTGLYLARNELERLPQTLANLKKLEVLDLLDTKLLYLPGNITHLSTHIDVEENPFNLDISDSDNLTTKSEVPSLMECSAEVIVKSGLNYANILPKALVRYLENGENYCFFCETPCFFYYGKRFIKYSEYDNIIAIKMNGTPNTLNASFECYACSPECATKL